MLALEEKGQNLFFEWRVKTTDDNLVGLANGFCPLASELGVMWRRLAGGEECHKWSIQKLCISG